MCVNNNTMQNADKFSIKALFFNSVKYSFIFKTNFKT